MTQISHLSGITQELNEAIVAGGDPTLREVSRKLKEKFQGALRHTIIESTLDVQGMFGANFLDPLDFAGDSGDGWGNYPYTSPAYYIQNMKRGEVLPAYIYEQQLRIYRDRSRKLCQENEYAICATENRKNYAVGAEGFAYKAMAANPGRAEGLDQLLARTQWVIDHWCEHNDMAEYAKDVMLRLDKDGEAFTRYFPQASGIVSVRTVEAEHVKAPSSDYGPHYSFGIQTDAEDIETREGYWIVEDPSASGWIPSFVPAEEVCHIKINTPRSAKRGLPTFYPCEQLLRIASDLLVGVAKNANHRAKIAMVRTVTGALADAAQSMLDELRDVQVQDPNTGNAINVESFNWGTILTQPDSVKTEFPNANFESGNFDVALTMILRAVAARLIMPEWMLTANAQNSNYSSSMIAEAPSTKAFEDLQEMLLRRFGANRTRTRESMIWYQIRHAVNVGLLPPETLTLVKIECKGPSLVVRDKSGEAQQNTAYYQMRAKSKRLIQMENNWDPEQVERDFAEDDAEQMERQALAQQAAMKLQRQQADEQARQGIAAQDPGPVAGTGQPDAGNGQAFNPEGTNGQPPAGRVPTREGVDYFQSGIYSGIITPDGEHEPLQDDEIHSDAVQRLGYNITPPPGEKDLHPGDPEAMYHAIKQHGLSRVSHDAKRKTLTIETRPDKLEQAKQWVNRDVEPERVDTVHYDILGHKGYTRRTMKLGEGLTAPLFEEQRHAADDPLRRDTAKVGAVEGVEPLEEAQRVIMHKGLKILKNPTGEELHELIRSDPNNPFNHGKGIVDLNGDHYAWSGHSGIHHEEIANKLGIPRGEWGALFHSPDYGAVQKPLRSKLNTSYPSFSHEHKDTIMSHAADTVDYLRDSLTKPTTEAVQLLLEAGFTGVVHATNGVDYHYVDGKRVPSGHAQAASGAIVHHATAADDKAADAWVATVKHMKHTIAGTLHNGPKTFNQIVSDMQGGNPTAKYTGKYGNALRDAIKDGTVVKVGNSYQLANQANAPAQRPVPPPTPAPAPAATPPAPASTQTASQYVKANYTQAQAKAAIASGVVHQAWTTSGQVDTYPNFLQAMRSQAATPAPTPAATPAPAAPPTPKNPYPPTSLGGVLFDVVAANPGLTPKQIVAKIPNPGPTHGKWGNALNAGATKGHFVKAADGSYTVAGGGTTPAATPAAPASAQQAAPVPAPAKAKPAKAPTPAVTPTQALAAMWTPGKLVSGGRANKFDLEPLVAKALVDLNLTAEDVMNNRSSYQIVSHIQKDTDGSVGTFDVDYAIKNIYAQTTNKWHKPLFKNFGGSNGPSYNVPNEARPSLSPAEKVAAQKYTCTSYKYLNDSLRTDGNPPPQFTDLHHHLQQALAKCQEFPAPVDVTRGVTLDGAALSSFLAEMNDAKDTGRTTVQKGYISSTVGTKTDPNFHGNVILRIKATQGLDMKPYTNYPHVSELLLNHNSEFKVTDVKQVNGTWEVSMEQVAASVAPPAPPKPPKPAKTVPQKDFADIHASTVLKDYVEGKILPNKTLSSNRAGNGSDPLHAALMKEAGRDQKPKVLDKAGMDALKAKGWWIGYRGLGGPTGKYTQQFRDGKLYAGLGISGNGTYVDFADPTGGYHNEAMAKGSASGYGGNILRIAIDPKARIVSKSDLQVEQQKDMDKLLDDYNNDTSSTKSYSQYAKKRGALRDLGRYAVLKNYDAIDVDGSRKGGYTVVLNRSILCVEDKDQ